jgi:hypothetical protein
VSTTFSAMRAQLVSMEMKIINKIDGELSQKSNLESQMRSIESQVNQLIGGLKNMSMLTDSQKLLILKNVDTSISNIDSK